MFTTISRSPVHYLTCRKETHSVLRGASFWPWLCRFLYNQNFLFSMNAACMQGSFCMECLLKQLHTGCMNFPVLTVVNNTHEWKSRSVIRKVEWQCLMDCKLLYLTKQIVTLCIETITECVNLHKYYFNIVDWATGSFTCLWKYIKCRLSYK